MPDYAMVVENDVVMEDKLDMIVVQNDYNNVVVLRGSDTTSEIIEGVLMEGSARPGIIQVMVFDPMRKSVLVQVHSSTNTSASVSAGHIGPWACHEPCFVLGARFIHFY